MRPEGVGERADRLGDRHRRVAQDAQPLDSARHRIGCPLLLVHGGQDPLARYEDQEPFLRGADAATATVRVWPDGEHTLYDHAAERDSFVAEWLSKRVVQALV